MLMHYIDDRIKFLVLQHRDATTELLHISKLVSGQAQIGATQRFHIDVLSNLPQNNRDLGKIKVRSVQKQILYEDSSQEKELSTSVNVEDYILDKKLILTKEEEDLILISSAA